MAIFSAKNILQFLILGVFLTISAQFLTSNLKLFNFSAQDFEVFYLAGGQVVTGHNPYLMMGKDIVRNPPPALLIFAVLSLFPIQLSQILWFILSLVIFFIGSYFLFKVLNELNKGKSFNPLSWKIWLTYLSLVFLFFPFRYNLGSGQVNNVLFLFLVLTFYLSLGKKWGFSALLLAFAIVLKITPAFLLYTLLIEKKVKTIFWTIFYMVVIGLITGMVLGFKVYGEYLTISGSFMDFGVSAYYNQSFTGFLARVSNNFELNRWLVLITVIVASISLFFVHKSLSKSRLLSTAILWDLSVLFMLIFAPFAWQYHFVIVIFPLVVTAFLGYIMKSSYIFYFLLVLSYLLIGWNIKEPFLYTGKGVLEAILLSHVFFGTVLLLALNYNLAFVSIHQYSKLK